MLGAPGVHATLEVNGKHGKHKKPMKYYRNPTKSLF